MSKLWNFIPRDRKGSYCFSSTRIECFQLRHEAQKLNCSVNILLRFPLYPYPLELILLLVSSFLASSRYLPSGFAGNFCLVRYVYCVLCASQVLRLDIIL
jgi:hypothetical protein